jgi:hypothetical protein
MLAALVFWISAICGHRSSRQIGGAEANLWRDLFSLKLLSHRGAKPRRIF